MEQKSRRGRTAGIVLGVAALALSGAGVAYAANGGPFILGQSNFATGTTTLNNNGGNTPLALTGPTTKAPLTVNSAIKVTNLNADRLDGWDSSWFQRKGDIVRKGESTFTPSEGPINRQSRAFCNAGEHAVGGGAHVVATTPDRLGEYYTFLIHSVPMAANGEPALPGTKAVGWLVEATNTARHMSGLTGRNAYLNSYVLCSPN